MLAIITSLLETFWPTGALWWSAFIWGGRLLGAAFVPWVLLQRSTRPLAALAWILALLFLPVIGILMWWIFGRDHMRRRRRRRSISRKKITRRLEQLERPLKLLPEYSAAADTGSLIPVLSPVLRDQYDVFPPTANNRISLHPNSAEAFEAFASSMERAENHIHFQFYIWREDKTGTRFRDLLAEKARQGVEVRVLFDAVGGASISKSFCRPLVDAGARVASFLPLYLWERRLRVNFRNHRKLLIVDGRCGFTGGVNVADEYLEWFDMAFGFEGPVVHQMQEIFAEDWYFATREALVEEAYFPGLEQRRFPRPDEQRPTCLPLGVNSEDAVARIVASGPDDRLNTIHKMFFLAITSAKERVDIITPYFVPDTAILTALQTAAMQGVQVRIILPGRSDIALTQHAGRSFWESLMEAGVRIFEFNGPILHAKLLLRDDSHVLVGSANMDVRSFRLNFEVNSVIESNTVNAAMSEVFEATLEECSAVDLEQFRRRPRSARLLEGTARLFSPLL